MKARSASPPDRAAALFEAEVAPGIEDLARAEIAQLGDARDAHAVSEGVRFAWRGGAARLLHLGLAQAVYAVVEFPVARPKALLGDQHFRALVLTLKDTITLHPAGSFRTLRIAAAGSDSPVMQRLSDALAAATGLARAGPDAGDLLVRVRPGASGWEALVRISPRPLATRAWRVCNYEGALNACIARAMAGLLARAAGGLHSHSVVLNPCCGSGTLMIEGAQVLGAGRWLGCDTNAAALACARRNITAWHGPAALELHGWDARRLPLQDGCSDGVLADLPYGHLSGSRDANVDLYPRMLSEAARVIRPGGACVLITDQARQIGRALEGPAGPWREVESRKVIQRGRPARIHVLVRL